MTEETRSMTVPPATQTFTYDDDGNLTADGIWTYAWDSENRLISMTAAGRKKLDFKYDHLGRRVQKDVYIWSGGWGTPATTKFLYDGWNLIAELDGNNNNAVLRSYIRGLDASGSIAGAAGTGGLLATRVHTGPNAGTYFYVYDGNHNIVALVNSANGASAAEYTYGPFGELLRATGPLAFENPFRFSTKYCDGGPDGDEPAIREQFKGIKTGEAAYNKLREVYCESADRSHLYARPEMSDLGQIAAVICRETKWFA